MGVGVWFVFCCLVVGVGGMLGVLFCCSCCVVPFASCGGFGVVVGLVTLRVCCGLRCVTLAGSVTLLDFWVWGAWVLWFWFCGFGFGCWVVCQRLGFGASFACFCWVVAFGVAVGATCFLWFCVDAALWSFCGLGVDLRICSGWCIRLVF